jgi:hypothetical protein
VGSQATLIVGLESAFHRDILSLPLAFFADHLVSGLFLIQKATGTIPNPRQKINEDRSLQKF